MHTTPARGVCVACDKMVAVYTSCTLARNAFTCTSRRADLRISSEPQQRPFFFMCQAWQTSARNVAAGRPLACLAQKQPWRCTAAAESDHGGLTIRHAARTRLHLPLRNCPDARAAPRKPEHACRAALTRGLLPSHVAVLCGPPHCHTVLVADSSCFPTYPWLAGSTV